jgi:HSP20 family protein
MNRITRFDPFFAAQRWDPLGDFEDLFRRLGTRPFYQELEVEPEATMRLEVTESDDTYKVVAELPGVKKQDISVSIAGDEVSISAEVRQEKEAEGESVLRNERYFGPVRRGFTLPQEVDESRAEAAYHDGLLELTLPKKPGAAPKPLTVK